MTTRRLRFGLIDHLSAGSNLTGIICYQRNCFGLEFEFHHLMNLFWLTLGRIYL